MSHATIDTRIDAALDEMKRATSSLIELTRQLAQARRDPDEWLRYPAVGARCPISGFSRSKIDRLTREDRIRRKTVGSAAFYSGADLRVFLNK